MTMLWFYCDESHNSQVMWSKVYVVAGFIAEVETWEKIEKAWRAKNKRIGVSRFHASHLNSHSHEFKGWTSQRSKRYVADLLKILTKPQKRLHVISIGMLAEEYSRLISDQGREKLGHPYLACFKACIAPTSRKKWTTSTGLRIQSFPLSSTATNLKTMQPDCSMR